MKRNRNRNRAVWWSGVAGAVLASAGTAVLMAQAKREGLGYDGTPQIPGQPYHVHQGDRPQPRVVKPAERFSHEAPPPGDATVLFDGKDLAKWERKGGGEAKWAVKDGYMEIAPKAGTIRSKDKFADFQMHIEWASPEEVKGNGQGRGNSGVLFNGLYEVQVLDSHDNPTYPDGQAGSLYGFTPPLANATRPPGQWQSYDIVFESPRWDESGKLVKKANVTVIHNGVLLHHKREFPGDSKHQNNGNYDQPHPPEVFIELQDHGNPVRYRNIWLRPIGEYDKQ